MTGHTGHHHGSVSSSARCRSGASAPCSPAGTCTLLADRTVVLWTPGVLTPSPTLSTA
ncbi:hypothetical protein [Streptomyces sp. TLI_053]|uniref:hypothetical protein n=1 Tax=Streptomyces sp. TLI_053 TaxID=1855352 RepID=UPI0013520798|nr:hypothetical protein [Streptomyces sp. TLI_053]